MPPTFGALLNSFHNEQISHNLPGLANLHNKEELLNNPALIGALLQQANNVGYNVNEIWNLPKPFIGLGNPGANILIIGKELAIDANTPLPNQAIRYWNCHPHQHNTYYQGLYLNEVFLNNYLWYLKNEGHNIPPGCYLQDPEFPPGYCHLYNREKSNGHTWQIINNLINRYLVTTNNSFRVDKVQPSFFEHTFLTELSLAPARNGNGVNQAVLEEYIYNRFIFLISNCFYNGFKTIVFACRTYLRDYIPQYINLIKSAYRVAEVTGFQKTRNIMEYYKVDDKKIIVTSQLSGAAGWGDDELNQLSAML